MGGGLRLGRYMLRCAIAKLRLLGHLLLLVHPKVPRRTVVLRVPLLAPRLALRPLSIGLTSHALIALLCQLGVLPGDDLLGPTHGHTALVW